MSNPLIGAGGVGMEAIKAYMAEQQKKAEEERAANIRMIEEEIARRQEAAPMALGLSPLTAAIESLSGTGGQTTQALQAAERQAQAAQGDIDDLILAGAKARQPASDSGDWKEILRAGLKIQNQEQQGDKSEMNQAIRLENELARDADKITGKYDKTFSQISQIEDAINSGDLRRIQSTLGLQARVLSGEVGALTDNDVKRVFGDTAQQVIQRWNMWLTGEGSIDPKIAKGMQQALAYAKDRNAKSFQNDVARKERFWSDRTGVSSLGLYPQVKSTFEDLKQSPMYQFYNPKQEAGGASGAAPKAFDKEAFKKKMGIK